MSPSKSEKIHESLKGEYSVKKHIVKDVVMKKLEKCKSQLLNDQTKTMENLEMPLDIGKALAVKFLTKSPDTKEPIKVQNQRDEMVTLLQDLMDQVEHKSDQITVVSVKTPAIDLDKDFSSDQLEFMKQDIFNSMKTQLGTNFDSDEIEKQWKDAFQAIVSIVDIEKQKLQ